MAYVWGALGLAVLLALGWLVYAMRDYGKAIAENDDHDAESKARDWQRRIAANLERLRNRD